MESITISDLKDIILDSFGTPQVFGGFEVDDLRDGCTPADIIAWKSKQCGQRENKEGRGYRSSSSRRDKRGNKDEDESDDWDRRESKRPRVKARTQNPDKERTANKRSRHWENRPEAPSSSKICASMPSSSSGSHVEHANRPQRGSSSSSYSRHRSREDAGSSSQSHRESLSISNTRTSARRKSSAYRNKKNRKRRRYQRMTEELLDKVSSRPSESEEDADTAPTNTPKRTGKKPPSPVWHPTPLYAASSDSSRSQESRATSPSDSVTQSPLDSPSSDDCSHSSDECEECPQVVALDCEMVGCLPDDSGLEEQSRDMSVSIGERFRLIQTGKLGKRKRGLKEVSEAGRCSVVDYYGGVLYDKYIRPNRRILSLRTFVSGITQRNMENATPINQARREILSLLKGKMVVAHDIKNDLSALDISLPPGQIRDTAHCRPLKRLAQLPLRTPASLRRLASEVLGMQIQKGAHSSVEDARVCMKLFRKVENEWL